MQVAGRDIGQLTDFEAMAVISEPARDARLGEWFMGP
jgi:hypothetical protein